MKYTIYKTINKLNGKFYIGQHKTNNLNDDYLGSGKLLWNSINKHGRENFFKEILFVFDNEQEMNAKEAELVTEEFCLREDTYNICPGGQGGWGYINNNPNIFNEKRKQTIEAWSSEKRNDINKRKARPGELNGMFGKDRSGSNNPRYNCIVTTETRNKISNANSGKIPTREAREKMSIAQNRRWTIEERKKRSKRYKEMGHKPPSPKGLLWWNDGNICKRAKEKPGNHFVRGRLF